MRAIAESATEQRSTMVLSHERLSGYPASGGYDSKALATVISLIIATFVGMVVNQKFYYVPYRWVSIGAASLLVVAISNTFTIVDPDIPLKAVTAEL